MSYQQDRVAKRKSEVVESNALLRPTRSKTLPPTESLSGEITRSDIEERLILRGLPSSSTLVGFGAPAGGK